MTDDLETVLTVVKAWDRWSHEPGFPFSQDHCINGTRVAIDTLRALRVTARPVSVGFVLFNKPGLDLFVKGVPLADWPDHAWSIGRVAEEGLEDAPPGRWNGHLVCEGSGWTLDISAGQFERPGLIHCPGPRLIPGNLPPAGERLELTDRFNQTLVIERWPQNNYWRRSPGWRLHDAEVTELTRRTRLTTNNTKGENHDH